MKTLRLKCDKCKHFMNYKPSKANLSDLKKKCVYCGKTFSVKKNLIKELK